MEKHEIERLSVMDKVVYRSKVDFWLVAVVYGVTVMSCLPCAVYGLNWVVIGILSVLVVAETCVLFGIRYVIDGCMLEVNCCGLSREKYDLRNLTEMKPTHSILSAPAASLDRLELRFGKRRFVIVSPYKKNEFVKHIKTILDENQ